MISSFLNTQVPCIHNSVITVVCCIFGVGSFAHFVWEHHREVFIKQPDGSVHLRSTNMMDRFKICILGLLLLAPVMASTVTVGFFIFENNLRFVASWGFGFVGYLISVGIHYFWNSKPGVMGIGKSSRYYLS